jgi:divinyl protochlorophyllide a 8-vinyl-reductase
MKMTSQSVNLSLQASGAPAGEGSRRADTEVAPGQPGAHGAGPDGVARIGPNSVLQTLRALGELEDQEVVRLVAARAHLPEALPNAMIPEAWFVQLVRALRETLPPERSEAVLRRSGTYTADYVRANRIPAPIRLVLQLLPRRLAVPLLLKAFDRHAWTFAGAGRYSVVGPFPGTIVLQGPPTSRPEAAALAEGVSCAYYEAAFQGLLELAARDVQVTEVACQATGSPACHFLLSFTPSGGRVA